MFNKLFLTGAALAAFGMVHGGGAVAATLPSCLGTFNYSGSIDSCTIAADGNYRITAVGATGGTYVDIDGIDRNVGAGGSGASVTGTFSLSAGDVLLLLVGQAGGNVYGQEFPQFSGAGGGGGSYVALGADYRSATPLAVGGGGGGAAYYFLAAGRSSTEFGGDGQGGRSDIGEGGAGGGGFYGSADHPGSHGGGGTDFQHGGYPGLETASEFTAAGGFGGGGSSGASGSYGGGGGGGYTGGDGGIGLSDAIAVAGKGGTSFFAASARNTIFLPGVNDGGDGSITIARISPVPLPASGALIAAALAGLAGLRTSRRRKKT